MDEEKGGQTQSLQEREDEKRRQSANWGRNGMERKKRGIGGEMGWKGENGISLARAIPSKKVWKGAGDGGGWGGQKTHDCGLGYGASRALAVAVLAVLSASRGIHERVQALLD